MIEQAKQVAQRLRNVAQQLSNDDQDDLSNTTSDMACLLDDLVAEVERLTKVDVEPVATLWREKNQKLYPGAVLKLTHVGEALPLGFMHPLYPASALAAAQAKVMELVKVLEKAQQDINWMINSRQFLNGFVFDYIDAALKGTSK